MHVLRIRSSVLSGVYVDGRHHPNRCELPLAVTITIYHNNTPCRLPAPWPQHDRTCMPWTVVVRDRRRWVAPARAVEFRNGGPSSAAEVRWRHWFSRQTGSASPPPVSPLPVRRRRVPSPLLRPAVSQRASLRLLLPEPWSCGFSRFSCYLLSLFLSRSLRFTVRSLSTVTRVP